MEYLSSAGQRYPEPVGSPELRHSDRWQSPEFGAQHFPTYRLLGGQALAERLQPGPPLRLDFIV
jgi:hypothetical protein